MSDYITIPLSKTGKYAGEYKALVSKEDAELTKHTWYVVITANNKYAIRREKVQGKWRTFNMHRDVMSSVESRSLDTTEQIDHINHDGLDNRRVNLRIATNAQNAMNREITDKNTSGFKGVSYRKDRNKWVAQLWYNGKRRLHKTCDTPEEAYLEYCKAAEKWHNDFANTGE